MANPLPIAEFEEQTKALVDQLFIANLHFQIGTGLRKSWREYHQELVQAHVFWQYTIHAHDTMAVLGLSRVYDSTWTAGQRSLTLPRMIATVKSNTKAFEKAQFRKRLELNPHVDYLSQQLPKIDADQIESDIEFCDKDASVKQLSLLRNKLVAHADYEYSIGEEKDYPKSHPLPYEGIQRLIDRGFEIVNRYSGIYIATT
ncbi:MAG: hypothetical protein ACREIW_15625, partial [Chthoniobacterales bacterium]